MEVQIAVIIYYLLWNIDKCVGKDQKTTYMQAKISREFAALVYCYEEKILKYL